MAEREVTPILADPSRQILWDDLPRGESGRPGRLHVFGLGEGYVAICFFP